MSPLSSVGKYVVKELVGEGAMGVVYRAVDPMLNRSVAVKVMNDALALDTNFRTRFLREAQAAGSLQHPNVITVYDCGETEGHLYIAMEYVEGKDLEEISNGARQLSLPEKLDIIVGVLHGLAYAHKRGIVHRDIKPANIRVNEEGRALIMDFGIAHIASSNVTGTGLVLGTPNYMAPEQVTGSPVSPQTDIFAVGTMLYELLTNVKPFEGNTLHGILFKIVSEMPVRPETIVAGMRTDLAEVVMKALAKDPADRFQTATEMANALTKISASLSNAGTRRISQTVSLRSTIDSALQAELDAHDKVPAAAAVTAPPPAPAISPAPPAAPTAVAAPASRRMVLIAAGVIVALGGAAFVLTRSPGTSSGTQPAQPAPVATTQGAPAESPPAASTPSPSASTPSPAVSSPAPVATRPSPAAEASSPDMSSASSLRTTVQQARARAVEAGASTAQLSAADRRLADAEVMIRRGQRDAAIRELTRASMMFGDAESAARKAAATAAAAATIVAKESVPRPQSTAVATPPAVSPPAQAPVSQPASNPAADIAAVVNQYERAIASRDVGEMKRVYPGMSAAQASSFEDFFRSVRSIRANFNVSSLQVDGSTAEAKLSGAYDFVTSNGKSEHQALTLQATLRKDGATWQFVSIR